MAPYEPPRQDLNCLQIQLFSSQVLKELTKKKHFCLFCDQQKQRHSGNSVANNDVYGSINMTSLSLLTAA